MDTKNLLDLAIKVHKAEERRWNDSMYADMQIIKELLFMLQDIRVYQTLKNKKR
jgi:hypothetical protein